MITTAANTRAEQLQRALFHGASLGPANPAYLRSMSAFLDELLLSDLGAGDLTAKALHLEDRGARAAVIAREPGVAAGLAELAWLYERGGMRVDVVKKDGEAVAAGETLCEVRGGRGDLLAYERVGLNLLQRLSGIATATRRLQERLHRRNPAAQLVATRKTPWGLLDKRAVHLGGGGTHRLGLWDAILVKNNHLALLARREADAAPLAARRAWASRRAAAFIEVEVRSGEAALAAARAFRELREQAREARSGEEPDGCPCLLLLDNFSVNDVSAIVGILRSEGLLEHVLLEASGNITEENLEAYAAAGVDAISIGALTHSPRALDISQRLSETGEEK